MDTKQGMRSKGLATVTRERELLRELVALVRGECPSLLNEDSGGIVRLSMAIDDALAAPPAEDENARTVRSLARMLGWENVPPRETLERDVAALKARAQAPPASDPPGLEHQEIVALIDKAHDELIAMCQRQWNREPAIKWGIPARPGIDSDLVIGEALSAARKALTARQSDPPGLVALVAEYQREHAKHESSRRAGRWPTSVRAAHDALLAYPLPASPQAETMPTHFIVGRVDHGDDTVTTACGRTLDTWDRPVAKGMATYDRDLVTCEACNAASPQAETTKGDE